MPCIFCLYDGGASGASGGQADANHQEDNTNRVVVTGKRESGGASGTGNQKSEFGSFLSNIKIGETVRQFGLKLVDDFVRNNTSPEYSDRIQFTWLAKKLDGVFEKPDSTSASGVIATIGTTAATLILPGGVKAKTVEEAEVIAKGLEDSALVCRGGLCTADRFAAGSGVKIDSAGKMSGASVNSAAGKTVEELSKTIPNPKIGVTTVGDIRRAGGEVNIKPTPNNPFHCEMCGITPQKAEELFNPVIPNPNR